MAHVTMRMASPHPHAHRGGPGPAQGGPPPHHPGLIMSMQHAAAPVTAPGMAAMAMPVVTGGHMVVSGGPAPPAAPTHNPHPGPHPHRGQVPAAAEVTETKQVVRQPQPPPQPPPETIPHDSGDGVTLSVSVTSTNSSQQSPQQQQGQASTTMANTKEKTPMCLINELARYNKIQHQYRLVNETGPAHMKTFTVLLQLGPRPEGEGPDDYKEEYQASGPSIKKAQHAAAAIALQSTEFKHPPQKTQRKMVSMLEGNVTPTVELNALAMKRGEPAQYTFLEAPRPAPGPYMPPGVYNQRYGYGRHPPFPQMFCVQLRVGQREYYGEGYTAQAAKHNSASKALKELRDLPLPDHSNPTQVTEYALTDLDPNADLKSPISLVHELALKRGLGVSFEVVREAGPPHMRSFVTRCLVGDIITEGEGNSKKLSKKRAADKMLEELKTLAPLPPAVFTRIKRKPTQAKKKSRNLIKVGNEEQKASPEYGQGINPISRLIQIQQAKKEKEPVFTLIAERGMPRRREFLMEVKVGEHVAQGSGPNKKVAKRNAAEALLQQLGYSRPPANPPENHHQPRGHHHHHQDGSRKVQFVEEEKPPESIATPSAGRQLVPGLLLMSDGTTALSYAQGTCGAAAAGMAKELLKGGGPQVGGGTHPPAPSPGPPQQVVRPKDQLQYLASVLGFQLQFTDFPKGNKSEYLSLVSLSTVPPQVHHGSGASLDASHDQASLRALKALADMGLDSIASSTEG